MQVVINDNIVDVEIIRKNNKNIYFRFNNGKLIITCNYLASEKYLKSLISDDSSERNVGLKKNKKKSKFNFFSWFKKSNK